VKVGIAGAGIIGASIAYYLSRLSIAVTVWESADQPSRGASGAALGVLMAVGSSKTTGDVVQLRLASLSKFDPLIDQLTSAGISVPYNRSGIVYLSQNPKTYQKWDNLVQVRAQQGLSLELWEPLPDWHSDRVLFSPLDRWVHPPRLLHALLCMAQTRGAQVLTGKQILPADLPSLTQAFDWIILTAGLGINGLLTADLLQPVRGVGMTIRLPALGLDRVMHLENGHGEDINLVPIGGEHYWVGATVRFELEHWSMQQDCQWLMQELQAFHPIFAEAEIIHQWHGDRPRPRATKAPIIGFHPFWNKVLVAGGHYRNGILLSQVTAQIVQDLLLTGDSPLPWRSFSKF